MSPESSFSQSFMRIDSMGKQQHYLLIVSCHLHNLKTNKELDLPSSSDICESCGKRGINAPQARHPKQILERAYSDGW
jgi:hypothetical protein